MVRSQTQSVGRTVLRGLHQRENSEADNMHVQFSPDQLHGGKRRITNHNFEWEFLVNSLDVGEIFRCTVDKKVLHIEAKLLHTGFDPGAFGIKIVNIELIDFLGFFKGETRNAQALKLFIKSVS